MGKDNLSFSPELNLYSLNNPGIPFLTQGEKPVLTDLARKKLTGKIGAVEKGRFSVRPISNLVFHQLESAEWQNGSWIMDVDGFDQKMFDFLSQPQAATVRLLPLVQELAELSGSGLMAEIGFNVGGGEIVFKRILLPANYQLPVDQPIEPLVYQGSKMPNVFVEAWDKLKVGDYDRDWDERVREQLAGNSRDMDKRIVYQMVNGEKWVEWNGVKMWAGLLSDRRDIGRFLAEESALATLRPGEFMVAKYSHGSGGAISAATAQQRKTEQPQIVGDVQMMGENGLIYQAAVEGEVDQIDVLISGLVGQLHRDHNLSLPETTNSVKPWLASLPILPLETYPAKFLLESQAVVELQPAVAQVITVAGLTETVVAAVPPIFDLSTTAYSWVTNDVGFIDFEFGFEADAVVDAIDWWEPDSGSDWDRGDDGPIWPQEPVPGGGLEIVATKTGFAAQKKETPVYVVSKSNDQSTRTVLVDEKKDNFNVAVVELSNSSRIIPEVIPETQMVFRRRQSDNTVPQSHRDTIQVLPPPWLVELEPIDITSIPWLQINFSNIQVDWTMFLIARHLLILNTNWLRLPIERGSGK